MARTQDWGVFPGSIDGMPAWITSDLMYGEEPDASKPVFVHVRFAVPGCNEEGLPGEEGMGVIAEIEDAVLPVMEEKCKALHVGSMSHAGQRHMFFYAATDKGISEALRPLAAVYPGSAPGAMSRPDPDAQMYVQLLMPDDWQGEFIRNHPLCAAIEGQGVDVEKEHTIEHLALFTDVLARERFSGKVRELGYSVMPVDDSEVDEGDPVYGVMFTHRGPLDAFALTDRTLALSELATEFEGEYDGWGAGVGGGTES